MKKIIFMSIIYSISLSFVFLTVQIKLSRFEFTFCNDAINHFCSIEQIMSLPMICNKQFFVMMKKPHFIKIYMMFDNCHQHESQSSFNRSLHLEQIIRLTA